MTQKRLVSLIALDLLVMLLTIGLIVVRYNSLVTSKKANAAVERPYAVPSVEEAVDTAPAVAVATSSAPREESSAAAPAASPAAASPSPAAPAVKAAPPAKKKKAVVFSYRNPRARKVELVGDFTGWSPQPMRKGKNGNWKTTLSLEPGDYAYNFLVDGKPRIDSRNTRTCDVGRGFKNSCLKVTK